ncbi:MAG: homoserine O-succinyltransferase [Caulobacterales bacterium]
MSRRQAQSAPTQDGVTVPRLEIGLVNNMPDGALQATERQFGLLLKAAGGGFDVRLRLFSLPQIERGEIARAHMRGRYADAGRLAAAGLDGLIVTGAEPKAPDLAEEPYWGSLTEVFDAAQALAIPAIWSCLAAHAAVLHRDGVARVPLPAKLSGVFEFRQVAEDPLLAGAPKIIVTPHSRLNGLDAADLARAGYRVLTASDEAGVDVFVGRERPLQLFFQGHPEYDPDSLIKEYVRDVGRFLRGERPAHPEVPADSVDALTAHDLDRLAERARRRPRPERLADYAEVMAGARLEQPWRGAAVRIVGNWLGGVAAQKALKGEQGAVTGIRRRTASADRSQR